MSRIRVVDYDLDYTGPCENPTFSETVEVPSYDEHQNLIERVNELESRNESLQNQVYKLEESIETLGGEIDKILHRMDGSDVV